LIHTQDSCISIIKMIVLLRNPYHRDNHYTADFALVLVSFEPSHLLTQILWLVLLGFVSPCIHQSLNLNPGGDWFGGFLPVYKSHFN